MRNHVRSRSKTYITKEKNETCRRIPVHVLHGSLSFPVYRSIYLTAYLPNYFVGIPQAGLKSLG